MLGPALVTQTANELEGVHLLRLAVGFKVQAVEPVVVHVVEAEPLKLRIEEAGDLSLVFNHEHGELVGDGVRLARVALDHGFAESYFAAAAVIGRGGVKVGEAALEEGVGHDLDSFNVYAGGVVGVQKWQTHEPKTEFFHEIPPKISG